jgi:hypothetical protein
MYWHKLTGIEREPEEHCLTCSRYCGGDNCCGLIADEIEEALKAGWFIDIVLCPYFAAAGQNQLSKRDEV